MRSSFHILLFAVLTLCACHEEPSPQAMVGFVAETSADMLTIDNDTTSMRRFAINEQTIFEGGALVEGNPVEVIYMPTVEGTLPVATLVAADATYADALGRWTTDGNVTLKIDIELLPHGRISQQLPQSTMHFAAWELTGEEDVITLHGTLSLPPDWVAYNRQVKINKDAPLPTRREHSFSIRATMGVWSDSNTESRRTLSFDSGHGEATLYRQE